MGGEEALLFANDEGYDGGCECAVKKKVSLLGFEMKQRDGIN